MTLPANGRRLLGLEPVGEDLGDVEQSPDAVVHRLRPLRGGLGVDALTPQRGDIRVPELGIVLGDALHQQVRVESAATLELDLHEPLVMRPRLAESPPDDPQVLVELSAREVLPGGEHRPDRRRVLGGVELQHLDRLADVEPLAVLAEVGGLAAPGEVARLAARLPAEQHVRRPPRAPFLGGWSNSL